MVKQISTMYYLQYDYCEEKMNSFNRKGKILPNEFGTELHEKYFQ